MSMQWIMRWGHDFPKDKGVGMLTLNHFGENPCVMGRTHQNYQLPSFLSSLPNHLFCQKVVEVVIAWNGKSIGKFEFDRAPSFGMSCFSCRDKKTWEPYASLTHALMFGFTLMFESCSTFCLIIHPFIHPSIHLHSPFTRSSSAAKLFLSVSFALCECFPLTRLWLLRCIVILNYRVYETLLLVSSSEIELWSLPMVVLLCTLVRV